MTSDRHYPGELVFPDLATGMIGGIETEVERNGKIEHETRYYLSFDRALCPDLRACRAGTSGGGEPPALGTGHVSAKISLASAPATGHKTWRSSATQHSICSSRAKPNTSLKNRRKRAGWNVDSLETLIRQTA